MPKTKDAPSSRRSRERISRWHLRFLWVWVWWFRLDLLNGASLRQWDLAYREERSCAQSRRADRNPPRRRSEKPPPPVRNRWCRGGWRPSPALPRDGGSYPLERACRTRRHSLLPAP